MRDSCVVQRTCSCVRSYMYVVHRIESWSSSFEFWPIWSCFQHFQLVLWKCNIEPFGFQLFFQLILIQRAKNRRKMIQVNSGLQGASKGWMMTSQIALKTSLVYVLKFPEETTLPFLSVYRKRQRYVLLLHFNPYYTATLRELGSGHLKVAGRIVDWGKSNRKALFGNFDYWQPNRGRQLIRVWLYKIHVLIYEFFM